MGFEICSNRDPGDKIGPRPETKRLTYMYAYMHEYLNSNIFLL